MLTVLSKFEVNYFGFASTKKGYSDFPKHRYYFNAD